MVIVGVGAVAATAVFLWWWSREAVVGSENLVPPEKDFDDSTTHELGGPLEPIITRSSSYKPNTPDQDDYGFHSKT